MPSEVAIQYRDKLNEMIAELKSDANDLEKHILAGCIELAVEEI